MKRCGCGVTYTREQWNCLPCIGYQYVPGTDASAEEQEPPVAAEFRNCKCGSTISVRVELEALVKLIERTPREYHFSVIYISACRVANDLMADQVMQEVKADANG